MHFLTLGFRHRHSKTLVGSFWGAGEHEVPGPGIQLNPQQQPKLLLWPCWILNPLHHRIPSPFLQGRGVRVSFTKAPILIPGMKALPLWPNQVPKTMPPKTITLEVRISIYEFERNINIQTIAVTIKWMVYNQKGYLRVCVCVWRGLGRMILDLLIPPNQNFPFYLLSYTTFTTFLIVPMRSALQLGETKSLHHQCSPLIPTFVWAEGGGTSSTAC